MSVDLTGAVFKKSQRSGDNGACVEVAANLSDIVAVQDSKDRSGPVLIFADAGWTAFLGGVRDGGFDK